MVRPPIADEESLDVLFIEDDPDVAEMYRLKLELDGYRVHVVTRDQALANLGMRSPDLVFLDLSAGIASKQDLLGKIRKVLGRPGLPAIILAGCSANELRARGLILGATDYVVRVVSVAHGLSGMPVLEMDGARGGGDALFSSL